MELAIVIKVQGKKSSFRDHHRPKPRLTEPRWFFVLKTNKSEIVFVTAKTRHANSGSADPMVGDILKVQYDNTLLGKVATKIERSSGKYPRPNCLKCDDLSKTCKTESDFQKLSKYLSENDFLFSSPFPSDLSNSHNMAGRYEIGCPECGAEYINSETDRSPYIFALAMTRRKFVDSFPWNN